MDNFSKEETAPVPPKVRNYKKLFISGGVFVFVVLIYFLFLSPPSGFPTGTMFKVEEGKSLRGVSLALKQNNIIRSRTAFEAFVILFGRERVIATDYYLDARLPVFEVARRISKGEHHIVQLKITIPEGLNNFEVADILDAKLIYFDKDIFLKDTELLQGSLFPDTYYFFVTDTETDVIKTMSENFDKKMTAIRPEILESKKTEKEILTMASIIEKEAMGDDDRAIISGILWKRLRIGMALQVDAAPETYKTRGLPKTPIGNPGLEAIEASLHPQDSPYLYYLHGKDGMVHYAKNFAEHKANKLKYLQ